MVYLLKMVIFYGYVKLPEGVYIYIEVKAIMSSKQQAANWHHLDPLYISIHMYVGFHKWRYPQMDGL